MSEILESYKKRKIEWALKIGTEFPLHYVKQQASQQYEFLFCVEIPWPLLRLWSELLEGISVTTSYIDLLNATVEDGWFTVRRGCLRIDDLLRKKASMAKQAFKQSTGRKRQELDKKVYKLTVRRMETESVDALMAEVERCQNEVQEWKRKYADLENEKEKLYDEMKKEINKLGEETTDLKHVNKNLAAYIETLEQKETLKCKGKKMNQVGAKQMGRKLLHLQNKAQCALWFCKSYGLEVKNIEFQDQDGGSHTIDYCESITTGSYDKLSQDEKNKIEQVLFLMDKFCVGDEVYHELSMIIEGLPKSYLVKQSRTNLNKTYHIERTAGEYPGASISFTSTLREHIKELLEKSPELKESTIQVKLSGDGARMSRTTNFMMMSFTLLQLNESVMSPKHNRTVAIINGPEKYATLKASLSPFFREVNELISNGSTTVDGQNVQLEFFLGGDMKFLLMIMGINSATADYACVWCKIHKDNRWDTSKPFSHYNEAPQWRNLEEIKKMCHSKDKFGCVNEPLINIPLTNVIPDELHLLLRITDKLLQNVIDEVLERDAVEDSSKTRGQKKGINLSKLVKAINSLGISFSIWNKKNADGSESQVKEFTSLLGSQKKKLLNGLPSKLGEVLYPDTCETVKQIWTDFECLYNQISDFNLSKTSANAIFVQAKAWVELFCSLKGIRPGYTRPRVTPYMHTLVYHIPFFVKMHGCFKKFTGQGVEKNNDEAKRVLFNKSNKWDAAKDILCTESRQWDLKRHERMKGQYTKRKLEYWNTEISEIRKQKRARCEDSPDTIQDDDIPTPEVNLTNLSVKQLRELIKEKGLRPKGLSKLKKMELIGVIEKA